MRIWRLVRLLPVATLALGVLAACTETKEILVDLPDYDDPPPGAGGFLGYTNSKSKTPVCGNCHVGQFGEWKSTPHASAWKDLQDSGHAAATCEGCHTVGANGNVVTNAQVGYAATRDERYHDVQCESCHGPGLPHVTNPDNDANKPYAPILVGTALTSGCGQCHQGTHTPFVEEWSASRHARTTNSASTRVECQPCHEARGILQAWGVKAEYIEKAQSAVIPITCAVCHDPHDATNSKQLRFPINTANTETNLCMKCHQRRSEPDPNSSSGPHSPQGPLLVGEGVGWRPPNFTYTERIFGTHGSTANPRLCAGCHVSAFDVNDPASGNLVFHATGHLFAAIPCLDSQGKPTTDTSCQLSQRTFAACATSGCHGVQDVARSALTVVRNRFEALRTTLDALIARVPATEFKTGDNLITTAEGSRFNSRLSATAGAAAHNPFLVEALLTASIKQMQTDYGLQVPAGLDLENTLSPRR